MAPPDPRGTQWLLLCEGIVDQNFAYHWLRGRGVPAGKIRRLHVAAGRGSGEQSVRDRYVDEVQRLRRRRHLAIALLVVIDADLESVDRRQRELDSQIPRADDERIAFAIPKRNIETWICYLTRPPVEEETDYKRRESDADACRSAARRLATLRSPPDDAPDSLRRFFVEVGRVMP